MKKIEGQYTIKKKWFNNKGKFTLEQQERKVVGTFTYANVEYKIDMGRINGDKYFEFCGSYKTKMGGFKCYSMTANVENENKFEGNFETKRGTKKVVGTIVADVAAAPAPAAAPEAPKAEETPKA